MTETTYDYYIQDIANKCSKLLTKEEEIELSKSIQTAAEEVKDALLQYPGAWDYISNKYFDLKEEGKTVTRMSEYYGSGVVPVGDLEATLEQSIAQLDRLSHEFDELEVLYGDGEDARRFLIVGEIIAACKDAHFSRELYFEMIDKLALSAGDRKFVQERLKTIEKSREKLVTCNLRLVISFAKKFQGCGITLTDLIQEGNIGLIRAAEKFDHRKQRRFTTYAAWWIRQACIKAIKKSGKTIRLPSHIHDLITSISKLRDEIKGEMGKEPGLSEVANKLNVSESFLIKVLDLQSNPIPLESPIYNDRHKGEGGTRVKMMKDLLAVDSPDIIQKLDHSKLRELLLLALDKVLTERERMVIILRFGLEGEEEVKLLDLAERMGKSRERVRQIEATAVKKLRDSKHTSRILREFLEDK